MSWVLIIISIFEVLFTFAKTIALGNRQFLAAFCLFALEAGIGVGLTVNAALGLHNRVVEWPAYPVAAVVTLCLLEACIVICEFIILLDIPRLMPDNVAPPEGAPEEGQNPSSNEDNSRCIRPLKRLCAKIANTVRSYLGPLDEGEPAATLFYLASCIGMMIYVVVARQGLERAGDRGVEITIVVCLSFAILVSFSFFVRFKRMLEMKVNVDSGFTVNSDESNRGFIGEYMFLFGFFALLGVGVAIAATVATAKRRVYVDSGVISILAVLLPGSISVSTLSLKYEILEKEGEASLQE